MPVPPSAARAAILGIGTATFVRGYGLGAGAPPDDSLLRRALQRGIRYIDTAADYADSEALVGRVVREAGAGARVCTKIGASAPRAVLDRSIAALGGRADTILVHSAAGAQLEDAPAIDWLQEARAAGSVARIGASTYGADDAVRALSQPWCDTIQVEYSLLNQSVLAPAVAARRPGQEIVARSVLCKGLLTMRREAAPALASPIADTLARLDALAAGWGRPLDALAIRFALDAPGIDVVVVGVSTEQELDAAVAAAAAPPLGAADWATLASHDRSEEDVTHPERWGR